MTCEFPVLLGFLLPLLSVIGWMVKSCFSCGAHSLSCCFELLLVPAQWPGFPRKCQLTLGRGSAQQNKPPHSGWGISWKWLCSHLCVTPSSEQLLRTLPFCASQILQASSSSESPVSL